MKTLCTPRITLALLLLADAQEELGDLPFGLTVQEELVLDDAFTVGMIQLDGQLRLIA